MTDSRTLLVIEDEPTALRFLEDHLPRLEGQRVALDIEEDRMRYYAPTVALVQVTHEENDFILDPILLDKALFVPLLEAVCHATADVVLHSAQNDVSGLKRDFGFGPEPIHDTQVLARFLGRDAFGLAALLEAELGRRVDKSERMSDWTARPLREDQLLYARADTAWLCELDDRLRRAVEKAGWLDAASEEEEALARIPAETVVFDPSGWKRMRGTGGLDDHGKRRLAALWHWRDEAGRKANVHVNLVCPSWALRQLAERDRFPSSRSRVVQAIHRDLREELGDTWEERMRRPYVEPETPRRVDRDVGRNRFETRMERLTTWRQQAAEETGLEPGWLAPRQVLERVAGMEAQSEEDYLGDPDIKKWRVERFGSAWLRLQRS